MLPLYDHVLSKAYHLDFNTDLMSCKYEDARIIYSKVLDSLSESNGPLYIKSLATFTKNKQIYWNNSTALTLTL